MSHKQIPQVDAEIVKPGIRPQVGESKRSADKKCRFQTLLMVFFPAQYGKSAVELFKEEKTTHLMGQCEPGKVKDLVGPIQKFPGQA
jgi:hypothetical protein